MNPPAPTRCHGCGIREATARCRWCGFWKLGAFAVAVAGALLAGCTTIDRNRPPPADWLALTVREHYVPHLAMIERCSKYAGWGYDALACMEVNFAERTCDLWFSADLPPTAAVVEHERLHCEGYDHLGEEPALANAWAQYKRSRVLAAG